MKIWLNDPKSKKPSATLSLFVVGFIVAVIKLSVSGLTIMGISFESFSGTDFAAVIGALGAIYGARKYTDINKDKSEVSANEEDGI